MNKVFKECQSKSYKKSGHLVRVWKEVMSIPLGKFGLLLLLWGAVASVLVLISFLVFGFYTGSESLDISAGRILFAYAILAEVVVGALGSAVYIAHKA
jgi:uncharacterized membrane protein YjfL (UPF0719 family)